MSFGMYLLAVFCSPAYFFVRKRWVAFGVHCVIYFSALLLLFVFGLGVIPWFIGALHAVWDLRSVIREKEMQRQAQLIAEKMGGGKQKD